MRLLLYAKATAATTKAHATSSADASAAASFLRNSGSSSSNSNGATKAASNAVTALVAFNAELLKPVTESSALTVVNAEDETEDVLARIVSRKVPPPAPGDTKKLRQLTYVNHSEMQYIPIRKDFYVVPPDMKDLTPEEMRVLLRELDGAKVQGQDLPRPLRSWHGTGLPDKVLEVLERHEYKAPFAVQSLGAPALMSGRDLLITAKTGSGKTLCYALPIIRHCADQPRCEKGKGPIGLVLVPTQELAVQVFTLLEELGDACGLRCVASYGSTPLSDNIRHVKAGCELMVATPGRLLDLLTVNGGKTMTLSRVSFVVVDEADRLFDSGFMEHVTAFLKNIRPDRVVGMISATMPKELRNSVMQHLRHPVIISVGGKPTPASNVEQQFFFFDEEVYDASKDKTEMTPRLVRLLALLGEEGGDGQNLILVFTQRKEEVDELVGQLTTLGYANRVASLYSGMDPIDREFALEHFAPGKQFILIATAVAERGLDIPYLGLVVNYRLPNHYEAYVHRIGRTGRAGRSGRAVSLFTRGKDDDIAPELVEGLERAEQHIPEELYEVAERVRTLRKSGEARYNSGFFRGYRDAKAQRFTDRSQKQQMREAARAAGYEEFLSSSSSSDNDSDVESDENADITAVPVQSQSQVAAEEAAARNAMALTLHRGATASALTLSSAQEDRIAKALKFAEKTTAAATVSADDVTAVRFQSEYPINDLPDVVRGKLQGGSFMKSVGEETETSLVRKGVYFDPRYKHSRRMKEGERPLYLLIVGKSMEAVRAARNKLDEMKAELLSKQTKTGSVTGASL
ncbi:putative Atp-dependent DEAD/H RNA helicase [Leptomonas pyrrhocoris]|uniref:RNA helicase n=1 Tax=Leptomonas pyrrhocoris TaxID=157538 RepID=A0A0M9FRV8_LEPPY|nr:putative Atp-dependent DEAD/H RNA helicase [Leptomonas pyrrhocoris]XP_015653239.1 putative Atp-dependent DEAD/H RNA helicase [Leptomonas pyrrhocoris]KPA74799.1 putative Atp-dependent DEAD/H RNA helicase [Leptomonas pyrrhocoris]KPA74800.1 putative Atp-dependent DEAD/H RNA helicase [Leptomonas pyrrhocoris]|eukprot:XP_015653238.1 putative Atp-dependent DEAD/H RNA helicase [Leptomonas pyrrhocoris]